VPSNGFEASYHDPHLSYEAYGFWKYEKESFYD
jgi:hypothetical protein